MFPAAPCPAPKFPDSPPGPGAPTRRALALAGLAMLGALVAQIPLRGDMLGLMVAVVGSLSVGIVLPRPESCPGLALSWGALAYALPLVLTLADPGAPLGAALTLGAVGCWVMLARVLALRAPDD
ncbi:MAG: hypothetical protein Kow0013_18930 [Pararhodobacter sp.]